MTFSLGDWSMDAWWFWLGVGSRTEEPINWDEQSGLKKEEAMFTKKSTMVQKI